MQKRERVQGVSLKYSRETGKTSFSQEFYSDRELISGQSYVYRIAELREYEDEESGKSTLGYFFLTKPLTFTVPESSDNAVMDIVKSKSYIAFDTIDALGDGISESNVCMVYSDDTALGFFADAETAEVSEVQKFYRVATEHTGTFGRVLIIGDSDQPLKPETIYTYRLARKENSIDSETGKSVAQYRFLTGLEYFITGARITETNVSISDIKVRNYGYGAEDISYAINNPDEEYIYNAFVVKKGTDDEQVLKREASLENESFYSDTNYEGSTSIAKDETWIGKNHNVVTTEGEMEVCIQVCVGEGELYYVRKDIPIQRHDDIADAVNIAVEDEDGKLTVTATMDPFYDTDGLYLKVYYIQKNLKCGALNLIMSLM